MKHSRGTQREARSWVERTFAKPSQDGFTLIELAVTMVAFAAIMIVAFGVMGKLNQAGMGNEVFARTQAAARAASDEVEKDLRAAGVDVDFSRGQERFVYADAYQIAFNADLSPTVDPNGTAAPAALHVGNIPPQLTPLFTPTTTYNTGAETIVYTLDSTADGVIDGADEVDDAEENTPNPHDMMLYRRVFGWDGNANTMQERQVALVRGPDADSQGNVPQPLFAYLIDSDDDRSTPPVLHGDADGDDALSNAEIAALTPLTQPERARLERIVLTVTGESERTDVHTQNNDGYNRVVLRSEVMVRHTPRTSGMVYGTVFQDTDGNKVQDPGEGGIGGVTVRSSVGTIARTNVSGAYRLVLTPGFQTITEVDPAGYISSTPNTINIDVIPGSYSRLDFGDRSPSGSAAVKGIVFDDVNQNSVMDGDEQGIPGVTVYSDGGEQAVTDANGSYTLTVPVGNRTITETDLDGYTSTTTNSVDIALTTDGQVEVMNFGDYLLKDSGTVAGYVYNDENNNQVRDGFESGVSGAMIYVAGDSVQSDVSGYFSITVPAGTYDVTEVDPPGYTSTTANTIRGVQVDPNVTIQINFGDMVQEDVNFDIITLADTERALSLASGDVGEDNKGDDDLVLGTRSSSGTNNLILWENNRRNGNTPNGAIFSSVPSATRNAGSDVMAMRMFQDTGLPYLILGLNGAGSPDISVWSFKHGVPGNSPDQWYATNGGESVLDLQMLNFYGSSPLDLVVGVKNATMSGSVELWTGLGGGQFTRIPNGIVTVGASPLGLVLGEAQAAVLEDVNNDGRDDLIVGARQTTTTSTVNVYLRYPDNNSGIYFEPYQAFPVKGLVTDLIVKDMVDDDQGRPDIVVATETTETTGGVYLWTQHEDGYFGLPNGTGRSFDDYMTTDGAPIVMESLKLDNDVFPDLLIGTRTSNVYQGYVLMALGFGYLPSAATHVTENLIGAVVTMTTADFNLDNATDFAVGTQNAATQGQVVIFYRQ